MFTQEEQEHLIKAFLALTNVQIRDRLRSARVRPMGDNKEQFESNLRASIVEQKVTYEDIVRWLDDYDPWRKQQIFLYGGRPAGVGDWANLGFIQNRLAGHPDRSRLNSSLAIVLPNELTIATIKHSANGLRVVGYVRRNHRLRAAEFDFTEDMSDGRRIVYHAFHEFVVRTAVVFDWDFPTNTAMIQIAELPSRESYEEMRDAMKAKIRDWFTVVDEFLPLDLRGSIPALHRHEAGGGREVKAYLMAYGTVGGRVITGRGGHKDQTVLGEAASDEAMRRMRENGVGRNGNFHWLADGGVLNEHVHVYINAATNRLRFFLDLDEATINHVVRRVRQYCV